MLFDLCVLLSSRWCRCMAKLIDVTKTTYDFVQSFDILAKRCVVRGEIAANMRMRARLPLHLCISSGPAILGTAQARIILNASYCVVAGPGLPPPRVLGLFESFWHVRGPATLFALCLRSWHCVEELPRSEQQASSAQARAYGLV